VLRASRGKGVITNIRPQGNLLYQPDIRLENTKKCRKKENKTLINVIGFIDTC
jgi:hypothetical protein